RALHPRPATSERAGSSGLAQAVHRIGRRGGCRGMGAWVRANRWVYSVSPDNPPLTNRKILRRTAGRPDGKVGSGPLTIELLGETSLLPVNGARPCQRPTPRSLTRPPPPCSTSRWS